MSHDNDSSSLNELKQDHLPENISRRLQKKLKGSYLREFIYGSIDGTVTTFAVVAGVAGANLAPEIVIILGVANLFADAFSMATGCFQSIKADLQLTQKYRKMEEEHIDKFPEGEREEIRQIFAKKGFSGNQLEEVVRGITADRKLWIDTMLVEEFGLNLEQGNPWKASTVTFSAFVIVGALPLIAYTYNYLASSTAQIAEPFFVSSTITGVGFFLIGSIKGHIVKQKWWVSGLETLLFGGFAASIAYFIGSWLSTML